MSIELMERALEFITGVYFGEHEGSSADREKLEADLTTAIQQAEAQQPDTSDLRIGVCITDGVLHATVMQHESNGAITVVATAEIDAASLHGRDCIGRMKPATPESVAGEWYCGNCRVPVPSPASRPAPSVPATGEPVDHVGDRADMRASKPAEPVGVNQLRKELSDANDFIQSLADLCVKYETLLGYRKTKAPEGASELAEARGESNVNTELDLAMPDSICDHVFVLDPKSSIRICNKCGTVECKKHTRPAPSVPDGYVLVPIEPTQAMMNVQTWDFSSFYSPREIWAAMLAAK